MVGIGCGSLIFAKLSDTEASLSNVFLFTLALKASISRGSAISMTSSLASKIAVNSFGSNPARLISDIAEIIIPTDVNSPFIIVLSGFFGGNSCKISVIILCLVSSSAGLKSAPL